MEEQSEEGGKENFIELGELVIQAINTCGDYVSVCGLPSTHVIDELKYDIVCYTNATSLSEEEKNQLFSIFEVNMRELYEKNWGWDKDMKWEEMFSEKSHYLLLRSPDSARIIAFSHFQAVWDDEDEPEYPVLYCFELHVHSDMQGKGIGKFIMMLLTIIMKHYKLTKLMLTVFQSNKAAINFYRNIGFEIDEQDPSNFGSYDEDYMIMSRSL